MLKAIQEEKTEDWIYLNHYTEKIEIDEDVKIIVGIINDIIAHEEPESWLFVILQNIKEGRKDVSIIIKSPVSRAKYYILKEQIVGKIYECCICKGLVSYEEILNEGIG